MRLLKKRGSSELGKVISGSASYDLWLENRNARPQVVGVKRCQLSGRKTVGKVWKRGRWGRRTSDRTEEWIDWFRIRFWEKEMSMSPAIPQPWLWWWQTRQVKRKKSKPIDLHHRYEQQQKPYAYRFFHFSRPPGLGFAFDVAKRNRRLGRIQWQKSKKDSSRGKKKKKRTIHWRRTLRVKVNCKVISKNFLKIVVRWLFVEAE